MTDWNYADVWETVADVQPEADRRDPGRAATSPGSEFDRGADGMAQFLLDLGVAQQDKVAMLPLQLPRVPPDHLRRHEGRPGPGQHQLPLRRRRAELPVGQRRRGGGRVPRRVHRADRGHPRPGAPGQGLALGRRRLGPVPRLGHPLRGRRQVGHRAGAARRGAAAATTSTCSTPAARPACPRASCGARTTSSPASSTAACATTTWTAGSTACAPRSRPAPGGDHADAGLPADARDRRVHRQHRAGRGRTGLPARVAQVRPGRDARHDRAREGQRPGHRGRPLLASRCWRCSTSTRASGT